MREVIWFPAYREYDAVRTDVSNAMMALLAGAGMASHLLQLTEGSKHLLPEVFPRVEHIGRFNLETVKSKTPEATSGPHVRVQCRTSPDCDEFCCYELSGPTR